MKIFRGVDKSHRYYNNARNGEAIPIDPNNHNDPRRHNLGDTESVFTSWSTRREVALKYIGEFGVLLITDALSWRTHTSPDFYNENEILISGIVTDAKVVLVKKIKRDGN